MATTTAPPRSAPSLGRTMLNKVPEVTLFFWIIKVLCTTVGETAADYLNDNLGFGLTNTTYVTGAVLAVLLLAQFRVRRYVPGIYWAAVAVISVFGTLITDNLTDARGVALTTTTPLFAAALALVFAVWWGVERTLSMHSIVTTRRESFYWLAILFTFALGTAAGDLIAEKADLGYAVSIAIFGSAIALIAAAHYVLKVNSVLAFWLAYILTRPLGASIGDEMSQNSHKYGGLGLGTTGTSYIFLSAILVLVVFLSVTKRDQTLPELVAKDLGAAWPDQSGRTQPDRDRKEPAHLSRSRILVVTDHAEPTEPVLAAIRARAADGAVDVRFVVPNPASAEWHPLHPERHEQADAARKTLDGALPRIAQACGGAAEGLTSAEHDPFDAIEQSLRKQPFDEILVFTAPDGRRRRLHLDLPHRLAHLHVPLTEIADDTSGSDAVASDPSAGI